MTTTSFVELPAGALRMPVSRTNDLVLDVADPASPWRRRDLAISGLLLGAGLVGIFACWFTGSGELTYTDQVPWLVNSVLCGVVSVLGLVYWLVRGFRQVNLMQRDVQRWLVPWVTEQHAALRTGDAVPISAGTLVSAPTMTRVHHAHCPMVRGKSGVAAVTEDEIRERGLTQCGACHRG
ncbi:hypothetical protein GCM10009547_07460 [Sporichthya brevicatena]|uniref:Uncharacterized protein n=1 Tax=Sporichthya brevicatena TaxID=171442 RepID=A0ABN1GBH4_9ACTN